MGRLLRRTPLPALVMIVATSFASSATAAPLQPDAKRNCVYAAHQLSVLSQFEAMVGRQMDCALVYNDAAPDWAGWEKPWFLTHGDRNYNWANWKTAPGTDRALIVTQNLFPAALNSADWRHAGAAGDYTEHARALARNLVAYGLGDVVIRLGHEANGDWYPDSVGNSPAEYALWVEFWRKTVQAMKSVPGANFKFDWCINANYRAIALDLWYPGDDVVDIVGIDAYDSGIQPNVADRWSRVYNRTLGIRDTVAFAKAHGKPISIPEWGVGLPGSQLAGGDNPAYVNGIGATVRANATTYQSYFYNHEWATQLTSGPLSLAAYRANFGGASGPVAPVQPPAAQPPPAPTATSTTHTTPATPNPAATNGGSLGATVGTTPAGKVSGSTKATADATARDAASALQRSRVRSSGSWSFSVPVVASAAGNVCIVVVPLARAASAPTCASKAAVANGARAFTRPGRATVGVRSAKRLAARRQKLTVVALVTPAGGATATSSRTVTVTVAR